MDKKRFYFKLDRNKIKLQLRELGESSRQEGSSEKCILSLTLSTPGCRWFLFYRYEQEGKGEDLINYGYNQENPFLIQFNYGEEGDYTNRSQATPGILPLTIQL